MRSTNNGLSFSAPLNVSKAPGRSEDPAISASGPYVYIAWNDNRPTATASLQLYFMSSSDYGVTWTVPEALTSSTIQSYSPSCFANPAQPGYVVVGSAITVPPSAHVQISSTSGNSFALNVSLTPVQCLYPQFALDYPYIFMVCQSWPSGPPWEINYTMSPDYGVTWSPLVSVIAASDPSPNITAKPFISVSAGVLHLLYWNVSVGIGQIWYTQNNVAANNTWAPTPGPTPAPSGAPTNTGAPSNPQSKAPSVAQKTPTTAANGLDPGVASLAQTLWAALVIPILHSLYVLAA